jgi:MmyB-like transcription regulator ligand binding domain
VPERFCARDCYREAELDSATLAPYRAAIERLPRAHEPYPAMVVDGRYNVIDANAAALALFGQALVGSNLIRRYTDEAARAAIVNWPDVARAGLARIRERACQAPDDHELGAIVCPEFIAGDRVIRTIGMAARFDAVLEVTLDELRIELLYPGDEVAEEFFRSRA